MSMSATTPGAGDDDAGRDATRSRLVRWLETGALWVFAAPFALLGLLIVVLVPGWIAVKVTEWTFEADVLALEIAVVSLLMAATLAALWWAFAHGGSLSQLHLGRLDPTIRALAVTTFAVATFSALTALLYVEGGLEIRGAPIPRDLIVDEASEVYVWHLVDTVPLLDIASNLQWEPAFEFEDRVGGLLLVAFKGFVILPLIQVARLIFAGRRETYPVAVSAAIRRASPKARIRELKHANTMAVDDSGSRVVVDVMSEVWTEDAPLRRIRRLAGLGPPYDFAYLLVVDGIAERARDRVEEELALAPLAARLVVWRSDESAAPLQEELERLRKEVARREAADAAGEEARDP
jgi:hypothetical protein